MKKRSDMQIVLDYQREITLLSHASALLNWDQQTYMPQKGVEGKAEQGAFLSALVHRKLVDDEFFSAVKRLRGKISGKNKVMIEKLYKELEKARNIPESFVEELSKITTLGNKAWMEARRKRSLKYLDHI